MRCITYRAFNRENEEEIPENYWKINFIRRLCNVVVLFNNSRNNVTVNKWKVVAPRHLGAEKPVDISSRRLLKTDSLTTEIKPFSFKFDFQGKDLRIAVPVSRLVTYEQIELYRKHGLYNFQVTQISDVADMLNATLKICPNDISAGFGNQFPNGTWSSYIGNLMDDQVDMTAPLFPFPFQYSAILMSKGVDYSSLKFFVPLPRKDKISLIFLAKPFGLTIWISIVVLIIINAITVHFLVAYSQSTEGDTLNRFQVLKLVLNKVLTIAHVLLDQPMSDNDLEEAKNISGIRIVYLFWFLGAFVLGNIYKSIVVSILVQPVYIRPPLTVSELIQSDFQLNFLFYKTFNFDERLTWPKDLKYPVKDFGGDISACLQSLLEGNNVCLFAFTFLYVFAADNLVDGSGRLEFLVSKDSLYSHASAFTVSQRNPHLKSALDRLVDFIIEGSLVSRWVEMSFYQRSLKTIHRRQGVTSLNSLEDNIVDKKLMMYPVYILLFGIFIGIVMLSYETLANYIHNLHVSREESNLNSCYSKRIIPSEAREKCSNENNVKLIFESWRQQARNNK
ncbi:unnamed protein product [Allacma fusca]|uniref:Uncharacterized protein n=1 Tax=Allacma fusca TaxID=39272 RepID=A0A8J2PUS4_9HEXA|nr:unnamed protein product [Allacma fusca]